MFQRFRAKRNDGLLAVGTGGGQIDLALIVRRPGARPELKLLESYEQGDDFVAALARLRRSKGLDKYRCTTLLGDWEYQVLHIDAPAVDKAELKEAVRIRIRDMIDYPVEAATFDLLDIHLEGSAAGRPPSLYVIVANNAIIAPRVLEFQEAKIPLEVIDIPEMAQRNLAALFEEKSRGLGLLAFNRSGCLLTMTYAGELYVVRRIETTAMQLAQANPERREQLFERIVLDVQRSLDNFERLYNFISLSKILVSPLPEVPNLVAYLRENLSVPVETLDLASVIDFPSIPELKNPARQAQCLDVIGAALRTESAA